MSDYKCIYISILLLCLGQSDVFGQQHFNTLYNYEGTQEFSRDIHQLSNGNIVNVSSAGYPVYPAVGTIIRMLDEEGTLLWEDYINLDTTNLYANWKHTSQIVNDSILITVASSQQTGNFNYDWPYFLKYDLINQELIDVKFYPSVLGNTIYSTLYHSDGFIYAGGVSYVDINRNFRDAYLIKLDLDGTLIWEKTIDYNQRDRISEIESFGEDILVIGGIADPYDNLPSWTYISRIDTSGDELDFIIPTFRGGSGILAAEVLDNEIYFATMSDSIITDYPTGYLCKFDSNFNLIWEKYIENSSDYEINFRSFNILDGQIVLVANILGAYEYTNDRVWSYATSYDLDANLNWEQVLFYDSSYIHHLDEIISTDNEDLIFMGTVFTDPFDFSVPFTQNMWLFRTDSDGCGTLQDSCYYTLEDYFSLDSTITSLVSILNNNDLDLEVLSNPFYNELLFKVNSSSPLNHIHYELIDINGRVIDYNKAELLNSVNTSQWQTGLYILNVYDNSVLKARRKLIKN